MSKARESTPNGEPHRKSTRSFGIGARLAVGFGSIVLMLAAGSGLALFRIDRARDAQERIVETHLPSLVDAQQMQVEFNRARASLREFLLVPSDALEREYRDAYGKVESRRLALEEATRGVDSGAVAVALPAIRSLIERVGKLQQRAVEVAPTAENEPATLLLESEAEPLHQRMIAALDALIDEEKSRESTAERRVALGDMADARGSLGAGMAALRAFLISAAPEQRSAFEQRWSKHATAVASLERAKPLLSEAQRRRLDELATARAAFEPLPARLFQLRTSDGWNVALGILDRDLEEPSRQLDERIDSLVREMQRLVADEGDSLRSLLGSIAEATLACAAIGLLIGLLVACGVTRSILRGTRQILDATERIAGGDLSTRVELAGGDEMARIGGSLDLAVEKLRDTIGQVRAECEQVGSAAVELAAVSEQMKGDAQSAAHQAGSAAAGASEINASVQSVAAATDELSRSIQDISRNVTEVTRIASDANTLSRDANAAVERLGEASRQIGGIVKIISSIAEQTNLLALNATIEAARAGEAGRGFAVVATEVKSLANETGEATGRISSQIEAVQTETRVAVELIGKVADVIRKIHDAQISIAGAVEEQNATTTEISRNVGAAAQGTTEIEKGVQEVARSAASALEAAGATQSASEGLSRMAEALRSLVSAFKT